MVIPYDILNPERYAITRDAGIPALPMPIIDEASSTVTYIGYSELGAPQNQPKWLIIRLTTSGNTTIPEYAGGKIAFNNVWNDRYFLSYSR